MELLKEEQDETKPTDHHQHWADNLLRKIEEQRLVSEQERLDREEMRSTNARLSQQIEETKDLQRQTAEE